MVERIDDMPAGTIGFRAWMTPGEVAVYDLDQEAEARAWVSA
jgi:hypothetical protein